MRLVSRRMLRSRNGLRVPHDIAIKELDEHEFVDLKRTALQRNGGFPTVGVPVYCAKVATKLEFWPLHDLTICEIVDLDFVPSNEQPDNESNSDSV